MAQLIMVFGRRGMGKTTLLRRWCLDWPGPVFTYDPHGQLAGLPAAPLTGNILRAYGPALAAVDEIDRLAPPYRIDPVLATIANEGRHYGITLVGTARRPRRVHRDLTALADVLYCARITEPTDLRYLADLVGPTAVKPLPTLPPYRFLELRL